MPARLDVMPGEPIVIIYIDPYDFSPESAQAFEEELLTTLDAQPEPVTLINVLPGGYRPTVDEVLAATQIVKAQSHIYHHANVKKLAAVSSSEALNMAYEGLSGEAFGGLQVIAFATLDEALAFARA